MTGKRKTQLWMAVMGIAFACVAARAQDVVIVANRSVVASQISEAQLREIFTGVRSRLNDGTRTVPVLLKGGAVHEVFLHHYVRDNPEEFRTRWHKAVFTGQGSMPKEFGSEAELLNYVEATPGAIGYVSRVNEKNSVKVLRVLQ
ncbi:MAG: substrate-binding domain-containing protein [Acidobacteriia bacterium]|nr:substrate-binding domain-containing protein [Terriglobia bacterium]